MIIRIDSGCIRDKASPQTEVMVNTALLARIEFLEAENTCLQTQPSTVDHFRVQQISHDDDLVRFYTGFPKYLAFFLGLL